MTDKQKANYNKMRRALIKIAREYQRTEQLKKNCEIDYGVEYEDTLEMAYDNIQNEAETAVKGIKAIK